MAKKSASSAAKKKKKQISKKRTSTNKKTAKKATKKVSKKAPSKKVAKKSSDKKNASPRPQSAAVIKSPTLKPGDMAPDFTLPDQNGNMISLRDFRGKNVVVYFYPRALTPGCTVQACELRDSYSRLSDLNIVVLGISADPVKKLKQFEQKKELNFKLLSDEDHQVAEAYGSWGLKKFMGREFMGILRQSFLIGPEGKVLHVLHKVDTGSHHHVVLDFFKSLG